MRDVREKMKEKTALDLQSLGHHFSQPLHGKHLRVTDHFDICPTNWALLPSEWHIHRALLP